MGFKSPEEKDIEEFLTRQPAWVRKYLLADYALTPDEYSDFLQSDWPEIFGQAEDEYLQLLHRCPAKLREYRERQAEIALSRIPSVPVGAPRKDGLAREAIDMQHRENLSYARIAIRLNAKYGAGTTTPGAIRQLMRALKHRSDQMNS